MARGQAKVVGGPVEGPWALPEGWRWERLGNVAHVTAGQSPSSENCNRSGVGLPFFQGKAEFGKNNPTPRNWCEDPQKIAEAGDLLISVRAPVGPTNVADIRCGIGRGLAAIRSHTVTSSWLRYWIGISVETLRAKAAGTTFEAITGDALRSHLCPIPPKELENRIVARIDALFADLEDGEALLARARDDLGTWRKALLKAAVTGELTADWRAANTPAESGAGLLTRILDERRARWLAQPSNKGNLYVEPIGPAVDDLPQLPSGWAWASLAQISSEQPRSFQSGPFGSALLHSEFQDEGPLVIGIDNVREGSFSIGREHRISDNKFQELSRFAARPNDVLLTVMATIGRTCVVPDDIESAIITKHVYRITVNSTCADPYFVMNCLRSHPQTMRYLFSNTRGQTRPGLNKGILESAPIPIAPLTEQKWLLHSLYEQSELATGTFDRLDANLPVHLRQSILSAAFRGDLVA